MMSRCRCFIPTCYICFVEFINQLFSRVEGKGKYRLYDYIELNKDGAGRGNGRTLEKIKPLCEQLMKILVDERIKQLPKRLI